MFSTQPSRHCSCMKSNQTSPLYTPPPCRPFQEDTFPPLLHPQSHPLPPLYPPPLPAHCCHPLPLRCHPNNEITHLQCFSMSPDRVSFHSQTGWFILVPCSHLFIAALLLFSLLRLLAVVKEPRLVISCSLGRQRGAGGSCISLCLTSLLFSIGAS